MLKRCAAVVVALIATVSAYGQDSASGQDEDDEQPAGLHARYQVNRSVIERVDPDIAFQWADAAPDERLPAGKFSAHWSGLLLLRSAETYRFHAFVQGQITLKINGKTVLDGETNQPRWISGPETALSFGDQPFELNYSRTGNAAQLKLYWSSNEFPLEPVPYHALFQSKASPAVQLVERGRVQFEAFRCGNCHAGPMTAERLEAPSLKHIGTGVGREWLVEKLMRGTSAGPQPARLDEKMPHFGFNSDDARAIVAALLSKATPSNLIATTKLKESERAKDLQAGRTLVHSVGCLACHTWNSLGESAPFGGGSLDELGSSRTSDRLTTWLAEPARLNARHRMPVFSLTDKERAFIVLALTASPKPTAAQAAGRQSDSAQKQDSPDQAILDRGNTLIEASRCALCHELPGPKPDPKPVAALAAAGADWNRACAGPPNQKRHQPGFPEVDKEAIRAYLASWTDDGRVQATKNSHSSVSRFGSRILERKNCLNCHDRDDTRGLSKHSAAIASADESLAGLHMTLIPPRLNAVGDRLHDAGLIEATRGEQKIRRLDWLRVRMPKFQHSPAEQTALLEQLIGHDRIPEGGPTKESLAARAEVQGADPQQILAGRELLGGKGFSCVACHAVKDYTPKVTALGTRGSNLHLIGQRMRTDYFFRWTRAPLRVMPGVEMPNYQRAHEFILPGQLDQQLIAIWQALNDPKLTAPTNPAVVEQLLAVGETDQPRVVRDVFTVPGSATETVARAYAVGLPGGHSLLLDLDTGSVRGWTLGDFARQRCEGKRWYWDLAGTVLAAGFDARPDILLVHETTGELITPDTGWTVECRLRSESRNKRSVSIEYEMNFSRGGVTHRLENVVNRFEASDHGWVRQISVAPPAEIDVWLRNAVPEIQFQHSHISIDSASSNRDRRLPSTAVKFQADSGSGSRVQRVNYTTTLHWKKIAHNPAPPLMSPSDSITSVPGFQGQRLPLPRSIMPTALAWDSRDRLLFTSLKGHLYRQDSQQDGHADSLTVIEEGLAAPYGVIELPSDDVPSNATNSSSLVVAHKPELLKLSLDGHGRVVQRKVLATGWGVTDDYHDWACGIARDSIGNLFIGLGSDYTFKDRPVAKSRWRGDILRIDPAGKLDSIARGLRYPTGFAIDDQDRMFCSDQQGVQNTFNELNHVQVGRRYGVPSRHEPEPNAPADLPAIQIPHPWTRSVNGIVWVPKSGTPGLAPFAGQLIGCEINNNVLIRMSLQTVGDVIQGGVYPLSLPTKPGDTASFVGPLCLGISPGGDIYVGGLQDGGWAGGLNMGEIIKLTPAGKLPNGIREIRATRSGFDVEFFHEVDGNLATQTNQYKISGYTRRWQGAYATPDSGHHSGDVTAAMIHDDGRTVSLTVAGRRTGHVYDISVGEVGTKSQPPLWPAIGHFTLHRIPD